MELTGKVIAVLPLQSGTSNRNGKDWKKQEYVIETVNEQYPHRLCFNLWGDRIDQFNIQDGELITVSFDIDAREYNGRWYTEARAWRLTRQAAQPAAAPMPDMPPFAEEEPYANDPADDLPF